MGHPTISVTISVCIVDAENPLLPFSTGVGLMGISEVVEPEGESTHDSVDAASGICMYILSCTQHINV